MTTPQHLSDRYELGEILGFGGMSEVHLARDVRLHRDVAVKVLRADLARDPSFYLRFRREAQNAAALNHPSIVAVYDTGEAETPSGPLPYIVMEYVDGVTLRDIVHNEGPMPPRRAIEIIADACQALNFSHQHGIIHRDVKPANIMISTTNAVKVMDFGIARALADSGNSVTQTAAVIGTAQYLSPEQARGETVDARSDVYSLGCVLYEILTGEPPFTGDSPVAVAYQHVREDPVPPSKRHEGISAELDAVVLKALAKNPDNRYQTAAEMRADLVRVHNGEAPEAPKVFTDAERTSLMASTGPGSEVRAPTRYRASASTAPTAIATRWSSRSLGRRGRGAGGADDRRRHRVQHLRRQHPRRPGARHAGPGVRRRHRRAAKPGLQDAHPAEARLVDPARPRHQHRSRRQRVGGRGRRDHHQRLHRTRATRGARRVVAELRRRGHQAESRRVQQVQAGELAVDPGTVGQGDRDQPAGQPDVGDHQRDHRDRRLRARRPSRSPTSRARPSTSRRRI